MGDATDRVPHMAGLAFGHTVDHRIIREPLDLNVRKLPVHPEIEAFTRRSSRRITRTLWPPRRSGLL
jgi:hypothetical protein